MLRIMLLFLACFLPSYGIAMQGGDNFRFFFGGKIFLIPAGFSAIAVFSGHPEDIYFKYGEHKRPSKYGDIKGWRYLAFFDDIANDESETGCDSANLISSIFEHDVDAGCDLEIVDALASALVEEHDTGRWSGKDGLTVYYSIGEIYSSLYLIDKKRNVIKIDTNFLEPEVLKMVIGGLL